MLNDTREKKFLESLGYIFEITDSGYKVTMKDGSFIAAARVSRESGCRRTSNMRRQDIFDNRVAAISVARDHYIAKQNKPKEFQHPPNWYFEEMRKKLSLSSVRTEP